MHATMYNSAYQHAACPNVKDFVLLMKMYVSKWDIWVVNKGLQLGFLLFFNEKWMVFSYIFSEF